MDLDKKVKINLIGKPYTQMDNCDVEFPFKQAEAMFYFLALEKVCDKDKVMNVLWGHKCCEKTAKNNFRNATYTLRKIFGKDILVIDSKDQIQLNADIVDLENLGLIYDEDATKEILSGFFLKDNLLFNDWVYVQQEQYKKQAIEGIKESIKKSFANQDYDECILKCEKLLQLDELEEYAYESLIKCYNLKNEYSKALQAYKKLESVLENEIFEKPGENISQYVKNIKESRRNEIGNIMPTGNKSRNRSILLERDEELNILWDIYFDFLNGYKLSGRNIIISGEEGVGKTHLAQYFFNEVSSDRQFLTLKVCCYKAQSRYIYKPIEMLMQQLATSEEFRKVDGNLVGRLTTTFPFLSFHGNANNASDEIATVNEVVIEKSLLELLKDLSKSKKMIIFLDDIQWADEATINLLQSIMLSEVSDNILFIMTLRSDLKNEAINQLLSMKNQLFMAFLPLEMFDYEKTYKIAKKLLPEHKFTEHDVEEFYTETYGNAFNIVETVNNIRITGKISGFTPNVKNVLENRLASFPKSYRQVIELIAMFYDGVSFMTLLSISKKEEYELLEILDDLLEQKIIKEEVILGKVLFMFTHPKMQEFVYSEISLSKKRFLHMKIGLMYESYLQNNYFDSTMYTKIMYHLSKSEDTVLFVKYAVKYMYSLLNTTHEFFPTLGSQNSVRLPENTENIESLLTDIMNAVESSPEVLSSPTSVESICEYYHIMARKFIRQGEYKQGLEYTEKLKRKAKELDPKLSYNYLLKAYNQEACSFINQYDLVKLEKVIEDSKNILSKVNNSNELFVWQRFEGLCLVMKNEYSLAKTVLSNSIDGFEESDEKEQYLFNLAAAYAWKGEAMRLTGDFDGAIESYLKSLKIYTEKNIASSICVFYMYIGRFYLQTKEYDKAYINAKYAVDYFLTTDLLWQRAISCAYYAYICTIVEEYDNILPALEQADIYKVKIGGEYEKAIVSWSKVMIYKALDNNNEIKNKIFSNYMEYEQNLEFASNMLKNYKCEFELELLGK